MTDGSNGGGPGHAAHDEVKYVAHNLVAKYAGCMALKAALQLGIPDIVERTKGGKPLTAEEILAQLPTKSPISGPQSTRNLKRMLLLLMWDGFFTQSVNDENETVYGPTKLSNWFLKDRHPSVRTFAEWFFGGHVVNSFHHLPAAILDESIVPFDAHHGMPLWEYAGKDPEFNTAFQGLMASESETEAAPVLDGLQLSGVLEGVGSLVDVGGGKGHFVAAIVDRNPHIKGINYDLPYVIAAAPDFKGVAKVAGNMFEKVPSGDAMFIKWILHDYDDKECITLLKNCFEALPKQGKVIIVEYVLVDDPRDASPKARMAANMDNIMQLFLKRARERTKAEYEGLITAAGFSNSKIIQEPYCMDIFIAVKE